jgi:hypothetical protein
LFSENYVSNTFQASDAGTDMVFGNSTSTGSNDDRGQMLRREKAF